MTVIIAALLTSLIRRLRHLMTIFRATVFAERMRA
jgi:hypothetical protein